MVGNIILSLAGVLHVNIEANALMYKFTRDMIELVSCSVTIKDSILSKPTHTISRVWITRKVRFLNNILPFNSGGRCNTLIFTSK
jgi:hypothetical protein